MQKGKYPLSTLKVQLCGQGRKVFKNYKLEMFQAENFFSVNKMYINTSFLVKPKEGTQKSQCYCGNLEEGNNLIHEKV